MSHSDNGKYISKENNFMPGRAISFIPGLKGQIEFAKSSYLIQIKIHFSEVTVIDL